MLSAIEADIVNRFGGLKNIENIHMAVAHTDNEAAALELVEQVKEKFGVAKVDMYPLSLSISCHIGAGSLAVACTKAIE